MIYLRILKEDRFLFLEDDEKRHVEFHKFLLNLAIIIYRELDTFIEIVSTPLSLCN